MDLLSGDQKGEYAPSVPSSGRTTVPSMVRTHKPLRSPSVATNAAVFPSGESAMTARAGADGESPIARRSQVETKRAFFSVGERKCEKAQPPIAPSRRAAAMAIHQTPRDRDDTASRCSKAHWSARFTSSAV